MADWKSVRATLVGAGCVGLLMPPPVVSAGEGQASWPAAGSVPVTRQLIDDVALAEGGTLRGLVEDTRGTAVGGATVTAVFGGRQVARTSTDAAGRFLVAGLRGGVYQLATARSNRLVRVWPAGSAPPSARDTALLVASPRLVRGQSTTRHRFSSDAVLLATIIAAGATIPWIIDQGGSDDPPGS